MAHNQGTKLQISDVKNSVPLRCSNFSIRHILGIVDEPKNDWEYALEDAESNEMTMMETNQDERNSTPLNCSKFTTQHILGIVDKQKNDLECSTKDLTAIKEMITTQAMKFSAINTSTNAASTLFTELGDNADCDISSTSAKISRYCPQCEKAVPRVMSRPRVFHCQTCKTLLLYQCNKCGLKKKNYAAIRFHVFTICCPKEILRCNFCNYTTTSSARIYRHITYSHKFPDGIDKKRSSTRPWYCIECNFQTRHQTAFDRHAESHLLERAFGLVAVSDGTLERNGKEQRNDKLTSIVLTCTKCNVRTKSLDEKSENCTECLSNPAFSCEICSEQLPSLRETLDHLNKYCGLKIYICTYCSANFTRKANLTKHIQRMHLKTKPHECPVCHGTYKNQLTLKWHLRTCGKPAHLRCCFCTYATKDNTKINYHLKKRHEEQCQTSEEFESVYQKILKDGNALIQISSKNNTTR